MKILSSYDAKVIDEKLQRSCGIDEIVLMENAGNDVYLVIKNILGESLENYNFLIFCGVGNNGGDGFVVARKLLSQTKNVVVFVVGDREKFTESSKKNFLILSTLTKNIYFLDNIVGYNDLYGFVKQFFRVNTIIVDAILGIGVRGDLREPILSVVRIINTLRSEGARVFSVDLPTGFVSSFDKGDVLGKETVISDYTITFFGIKAGMFLPEMKEVLGDVKVSTLGFSEEFLDDLIDSKVFHILGVEIPKRKVNSDKWTNGKVVFVGGSDRYFGALLLAIKAASKTGVGYISAIVLEKFNSVIKSFVPDVVSIPLPSGNRGVFSEEDISFIVENNLIKDEDVVVIGNGLTTDEKVRGFLKKFLGFFNNILVLDADALNIISKDKELKDMIKGRENIVITPHLVEFSRLVGVDVSQVREKPFSFGEKFSKEYRVNLVLKDNVIYSFFVDGDVWISDLNSVVLARAGSGDLLSGFVGGNVAFTKDIKLGTLVGVRMLGEFSRKWNSFEFYPSTLELLEGRG